MSQPTPHSQSKPYMGTMKIFPIVMDESKLNFIFFSEQEAGLQHLKIADKTKASKLSINQWFKLWGFKIGNESYIIDQHSSVSLLNAPKPEITLEMKSDASNILKKRQYLPIPFTLLTNKRQS